MINIVIVGRSSLGICDGISKIVTGLGIEEIGGVITYSPELCCIDMSSQHRDSPYLIVRGTDGVQARAIAKALNEKLEINVEVDIIDKFLSRLPEDHLADRRCRRCRESLLPGNSSLFCSNQCAEEHCAEEDKG